MVRIIGFKERKKETGEEFFVLEVQGGIDMVLSQTTGNFYATAKKAYISSTFDAETCKALVGTELPGSIVKQDCTPFNYVIKETGEEIMLSHRWVYNPNDNANNESSGSSESLLSYAEDKFAEAI